MNSNPTPAAVLAAVLAGKNDLFAYGENGAGHCGQITKRTDANGASDVVVKFETFDGDEGRPSGTFLIAVRLLDLESPAEQAVADAGGLAPDGP